MSEGECIPSAADGRAGPADRNFIVSTLSPSRAQERLAAGMVLVMLATFFLVAAGLSGVALPRIEAFVPAYAVTMFLTDSITAVLLFAQFSMLRSRALLAIANGYLFAALMLIPWTLTFPGVLAPNGVLGGLQSAASLYFLWHAGFPAFVIAYALRKKNDAVARSQHPSPGRAMLAGVAWTATLVCAATVLVTVGHDLLPRVLLDETRFSSARIYEAGCAAAMSVVGLVVLFRRRRSMLDLFLMVVLCAFVVEIALATYPVAERFTIGWYAGRILGVLSGSILLLVLLYEIAMLYAQLLRAVEAQQRERDARLLTGEVVSASIAHQLNQPLSAMIANADAGLLWIDRATPELDEAKAAFEQIAADGHRAGAVIESIRAIFTRDLPKRTLLNLNDLIWEALALLPSELQTFGVSVETELNEPLPSIRGDHVQLQQVLVNLITNAIESMAGEGGARLLRVKSGLADGGVTVAVEDSGKGLDPRDFDRVFDPLFTTKPHGMGMGLSICRSIIEAHDGRLWAVPNGSRGAVFQFTLPTPTDGRRPERLARV